MEFWEGSAAVCINESGEVLMVKQGKEHEEKRWAVPAGGKEINETFEECCLREVFEETGYEVEITRPLFMKNAKSFGIEVNVQYFEVIVIGGEPQIQDPDGLIHEIAWKKINEMKEDDFGFPEDREYLLRFAAEKHLQEI